MHLKHFLAASVAGIGIATLAAAPAAAQQITSGIEGTVEGADGVAIPGATVVIRDTRTGRTQTSTTGNDGRFRAESLTAGGPYTITATAPGFEGQTVEGVFITIQGNTALSFELAEQVGATAANTIVVSASRVNLTQLAVGPSSAFGEATIESFPSISRDVRDIIRLDPRVSLERDNEVDRISCLGGNDRTNTFTVDGIVQADVFGLNGTPFAARNSLPLPYDVVRETSVEFAPFDVEYSDFTGCLVNVVTKSGTNEFHGSAFYTYYDDSMLADDLNGRPLSSGSEKRWGATLGGPIIPDRLFFQFGYEQTDLGDANDEGPRGGGFANEVNAITQSDFDRFAQIARDVYGQDIGGYPRTLPESNERYFGRIDWLLSDDHRLELSYQRLEESNVEPDFGGGQLGGLNSFEEEGTVSNYYSARVYSDWSDRFSTELRMSLSDVNDVQGPFGFGEAQSENPTVRLQVGTRQQRVDSNGNLVFDSANNPVYDYGALSTGPGIFRSANALTNEVFQAKLLGKLDLDDHQVKIGAEMNSLEVYNLFAINATGTLYFANLDDFEDGILSNGFDFFPSNQEIFEGTAYGADINATPTGDINEAAATFTRNIYSVYAQDEWQATDQLSLIGGVRLQFFSGDAPRANPNFFNRYGFTNANGFGQIDPVVLPRLGFTYEFFNDGMLADTRVTGGVGVFSGGDPVVYYSNAFSNNGYSSALGTSVFCATTPTDVVQNGSFTGFPQCVTDSGSASAAAGLADTQSTDPNFDVPTVTRANIGIQTDLNFTDTGFFSDWQVNLDYIYSRFNNTLNFVDLSQTPNPSQGNGGFMVDGRPIYDAIDPSNAGCNAVLQGTGGTPPVYTGVTAPCFATGRDDEIQLTNGPGYESHVASFLLTKRFDRGIFTDGGGIAFRAGYTFIDSKNNRNVGSSTATSSYDVTAAFDRQNPAVSTSNYETRHNFVVATSFREQFFGEFDTRLGVFFRASEGRPYSLVFSNGGVFNDSSSGSFNALLYVPSGPNDPNVAPASQANAQAVLDYVSTLEDCEFTPGQSIERNTCRNPWSYDLDLRFSQEIPGPGSLFGVVEDEIELFVDFDNFLNLIDGGANIRRFTGDVGVANAGYDSQGRYVIGPVRAADYANQDDYYNIATSASAWKIQVGARYEF
ncbi:Oar protein [Blastomonas marina]|uniref:Oar protein n=1 Tax=Blastomonas marina TaxID=1867408 RepID=A0ABQ1F496_9SPHN|nr:TonB-dependent receptor [Blastomonas marina]GFZ99589.1 Oar protein [Blastomonas marina]